MLTHRSGRVLTVTFDNPPRHFFDEQMSIELDDLTRALQRDSSLGAVIFTGTDTTYLTHFDVPTLLAGARAVPRRIGYRTARVVAAAGRVAVTNRKVDSLLRRTAARDALLLARTYAAVDRLSRLDKVVITAINGLALGMGAIFALACDVRVMADDAHIGVVEAGLGLLGGSGGTQRLTRTAGTGTSIELLLEGRLLTAAEAERLRIVHHVHPRAELDSATMDIAQRLAGRPAAVTREIKRAVYDSGSRSFKAGLWREAAGTIRTMSDASAERALAVYDAYLATHAPLTDDVVMRAWGQLLGGSVLETSRPHE